MVSYYEDSGEGRSGDYYLGSEGDLLGNINQTEGKIWEVLGRGGERKWNEFGFVYLERRLERENGA